MISPWAIYLVDVLANIKNMLNLVWVFSLMGTSGLGIWLLFNFEDMSEENKIFLFKLFKICLLTLVVSITLNAFIPNKETMYTMLIVDQLTPENIKALRDFGVETVQQLGDAIANSINKVEVK